MAFLGMCSTKRGCKRLAKKRADKRKLRNERKISRIAIKSKKVGVDEILAQKGIDSRGTRNSNMWGGITKISDSAISGAVSIASKSPKNIRTTGRVDTYKGTNQPKIDILRNTKTNYASIGIFGLIALLLLKFNK
jgi:hypothetical protein